MASRSGSTDAKARKLSRIPSDVYLLDKLEDDIKGSKLPSNRQALGYLLHLHLKLNKTIKTAVSDTVEKVELFWKRARIPVRQTYSSKKKMEKILLHWQALKKNKDRTTPAQAQGEQSFKDTLDDVFDIAHTDALKMIRIEEDRQFLISQRMKGRPGILAGIDKTLSIKETKKHNLEYMELKRREKAANVLAEFQEITELESSGSSVLSFGDGSNANCHTSTSEEFSASPPSPPKSGRKVVLTQKLSATLDQYQLSDRAALIILGETAKALGHDLNSLILNRSSISRQRQKWHQETAMNIMDEFDTDDVIIVHWDGKLLPDLTNNEKVDRLPIIISSSGNSQLLEAPKLELGTGLHQAQAVVRALNGWGVAERVKGICFDTTSANTDRHKGACIMVEQLLDRELLYLACRHHILELLAGAAFETVMHVAPAQEVLLFKRFQTFWSSLDQEQFQDASSDEVAAAQIADIKEEILTFVSTALIHKQPRDDCRELLELTAIFLGSSPPRGTRFHKPSAMHQTRWMSKVIYTFKVWMFRSQFTLTTSEEHGLRDLCVFFTRLYIKAWITAPLAVSAPQNDLHLLQALGDYASINNDISRVTAQKIASHLWYLNEELVGLALFDDNVSKEVKKQMVQAINFNDGMDDPPKRVTVTIGDVQGKTVADFATKQTKNLFTRLNINDDFLKSPVEQWHEKRTYRKGLACLQKLSVTNDHAERAVALAQAFSGRMTKDEDQRQYMLQVLADHRRRVPHGVKRTLQH